MSNDARQCMTQYADGMSRSGSQINWSAVGWCTGNIIRGSADRRRKIDGEIVDYIVYHDIDDEEAEHVLTLNNFYKYN